MTLSDEEAKVRLETSPLKLYQDKTKEKDKKNET